MLYFFTLSVFTGVFVIAVASSAISTENVTSDIDYATAGTVFYSTANDYTNAISSFRDALSISPEKLWYYLPLVKTLLASGNNNKKTWKTLANEIDDNIRKSIELSISADLSKVSPSDIAGGTSTYYALAQSSEEAGDYDNAWKYYNSINKFEKGKKSSTDLARLQEAKSYLLSFDESYWPVEPHGIESRFPIFVVGLPYSGLSLLEKVLDAHSKIFAMNADPNYFRRVASNVGYLLRNGLVNARSRTIQQAVNDAKSAVNPSEGREKVESAAQEVVRDMTMIARYVTRAGEGALKHSLDTDLGNFLLIGVIHYLFPNAIIVNLVRDPMDTLIDCFRDRDKQMLSDSWADNLEDLAIYYTMYLEVMAHWRKLLPKNIVDVNCEELRDDPEQALAPLLRVVGLEWEPAQELTSAPGKEEMSYAGEWRRYEEHTQRLRASLSEPLARLLREDGLAFRKKLNWALSPQFKYPHLSAEIEVNIGGEAATAATPIKISSVPKKAASTRRVDPQTKDIEELHEALIRPGERAQVRALSAQLPHTSGDAQVDDLVTVGYLRVQQRPPTGAEDLFRRIIALRPAAHSAYLGLAALLANLNRHKEAVDVYSALVAQDENCVEAYRRRAELHLGLGDPDSSMKDLTTALEIEPNDAETLIARYKDHTIQLCFIRISGDPF